MSKWFKITHEISFIIASSDTAKKLNEILDFVRKYQVFKGINTHRVKYTERSTVRWVPKDAHGIAKIRVTLKFKSQDDMILFKLST